jgi:hypothetical protein
MLAGQRPLAPGVVFFLPHGLEPGDDGRREALACGPRIAARASEKSPVLMPLRYSQGINSSMLLVFCRYGGRIAELNFSR